MKKQFKLLALTIIGASALFISSCKKDDVDNTLNKERSELIFTRITGDGVVAHSDILTD